MTIELYNWLKDTWKRDNHTKYFKYFEEWVLNLTIFQQEGFENQRNINLNI
jgi:hypothetical protein